MTEVKFPWGKQTILAIKAAQEKTNRVGKGSPKGGQFAPKGTDDIKDTATAVAVGWARRASSARKRAYVAKKKLESDPDNYGLINEVREEESKYKRLKKRFDKSKSSLPPDVQVLASGKVIPAKRKRKRDTPPAQSKRKTPLNSRPDIELSPSQMRMRKHAGEHVIHGKITQDDYLNILAEQRQVKVNFGKLRNKKWKSRLIDVLKKEDDLTRAIESGVLESDGWEKSTPTKTKTFADVLAETIKNAKQQKKGS